MDTVRPLSLGYSLKNIPVPSEKEYTKCLITRVEDVVKRMRWKALFYLKGDNAESTSNKYGFRSKACPPQIEEMKPFEEDLYSMMENLSFRRSSNKLQDTMRKDMKLIRECGEVIVSSDKTRNLYRMPVDQYKKLLRDNVTSKYKLAPDGAYADINAEANAIAEEIELDDRMESLAKAQAFITLKDHKPGFSDNLPCRLINPAKPEMGIVSKALLDDILGPLRSTVCRNLWKNTKAVTDWFKATEDKPRHTFIVFDIVDFYPTITEDLIVQALSYAKTHVPIPQKSMDIIMNARKSLLFNEGRAWMKKEKNGVFDVTMGSHDGAETCELVGALILSKLQPLLGQECVGLYRDDGLAVLKDASGHDADRIRKKIIDVFKSMGLNITIEVNRKVVDYLDITMNLATSTFQPFHKPNSTPLYVDVSSNHPPQVLKSIPVGINKRLQSISCNEAVFNDAKPLYQNALAASGHPSLMEYKCQANERKQKKKKRKRDIIWFNPPFSANVKTNVGAKFLQLVQKHFGRGSKLSKIFSKNKVKISYSCMSNMASFIKGHNAKLLQPSRTADPCNCRVKAICPLQGDCQTTNVVYQAEVSSNNEKKTYVGMTANTFKSRHTNHQSTFRHEKYINSTELSKHAWDLKHQSRDFEINWVIKECAPSYTNVSKKCKLCVTEKYHILKADKATSLNKKSELISKCRHQRKFLLANAVT